jgi:23S rRNA (guanosine2251-2'-O)-methyltransferase
MNQKYRQEEEEDIIYGVRSVIEAVRADRPINKILIQRGMQKDLFYELKEELANKNTTYSLYPFIS